MRRGKLRGALPSRRLFGVRPDIEFCNAKPAIAIEEEDTLLLEFTPRHLMSCSLMLLNTAYKLAWPRKAFYLATFFQYNKRLLRQKTGGACLYMPQNGHWLASFE